MRPNRIRLISLAVVWSVLNSAPAAAAELTIYSTRHYQADRAVWDAFTAKTGVGVIAVQAPDESLTRRVAREGRDVAADVIVAADVAALIRLADDGLLAPLDLPEADAIPAAYRDPQGYWCGVSLRARVLIAAGRLDETLATRYEDLANPRWRGRVTMRAADHPYSIGLVASLTAALGDGGARLWAQGVAANLARPAAGNDTDQIRAVAGGLADLTVANHYYLTRLATSADAQDRAAAQKVRAIFPNQADRGAFVSLSAAAIARHAPQPALGRALLRFLLSAEGQTLWAKGSFEIPTRADAEPAPGVASLSQFRADGRPPPNAAQVRAAAELLRREGWR